MSVIDFNFTLDDIEVISDVKQTRSNIGGVADKILANIKGVKVLIKGESQREAYREYVVYKLAKELGLNVNVVGLADCGKELDLPSKIVSVHIWEELFVEAIECYEEISEKEIKEMELLDKIVSNSDRHRHNYGLVEDKFLMIDHAWCRVEENFDPDDYKYSLPGLLENPLCKEVIERFISLTDVEIACIITVPEQFGKGLEKTIEKVYDRFISTRNYFKHVLSKENDKVEEVKAKWAI